MNTDELLRIMGLEESVQLLLHIVEELKRYNASKQAKLPV